MDLSKPILITGTVDLVSLVKHVYMRLMDEDYPAQDVRALVGDIVNAILAGLQRCASGHVVLLLQVQRLTNDTPALDRFRVRFLSAPYGWADGGMDFGSIDRALELNIVEKPINGPFPEMENRTFAGVVVTNVSAAKGQMTHPGQLQNWLESIAEQLPPSEAVRDGVRILEVLETACLRAQRVGARHAGVAMRDVTTAAGRSLELEPLVADNRDMFRVHQLDLRRDGWSCVGCDIAVQEIN